MIGRSVLAVARSVAVVMIAALAACAMPSRTIKLEDRDDALEFRQSLEDYSGSVSGMIRDTQHGKAISDFSMGMLAYDILATVSSVDSGLHGYFTAGGQDIESYLRTRFQARPAEEISALDKMNGQGSPTLRSVARNTLDALAHIPDSHDPPAVQRINREQLEKALVQTKAALDKAAQEVSIP